MNLRIAQMLQSDFPIACPGHLFAEVNKWRPHPFRVRNFSTDCVLTPMAAGRPSRMVHSMQINPAYRPATSDQDRAAAMAEASLLLQEVGLIAASKKARLPRDRACWTERFKLRLDGTR